MPESWEEEIARIEAVKKMSLEEARREVLLYEARIDTLVLSGGISQEEAWDMYFGLLHECNERNLREDRERIVKKIDIHRYNPFASKNPQIRFLAQFRARAMGLVRSELN